MTAPAPESTATGQVTTDRKAEIRRELEATRDLYRDLATRVTHDIWNKTSGNPAWTVGQVLGHMVLIFQAIPWKMNRLRKGKGAPKPPDFIFDRLNVVSTKFGTRKFTPENILQSYDEAHAAAVQTLEEIEDHEWPLSATFFGVRQDTAELFHYHASHVREHEPDIRAVTG